MVRYYKTFDVHEVYRDFSPLELLAELQQHIPDEPQKKASPTWAAMIKRVYPGALHRLGKLHQAIPNQP